MKMNKEIVNERRKKVMQVIQKEGKAVVDDLAALLDVSPLTIRRDLQYWEEQGAIERYYGGARLVQSFVDDAAVDNNEPYKHAIAKYAAQYVEDGDTIFINTSSTALLVLKYIRGKRVTVITNNGKAIFMNHDPQVAIVLSGGELRIPKESMVGDFALNNLNRVSANKSFLGCSGIDINVGMTTAILQEVTINEAMINHCKGDVFLLADHTKIGNVHQFIASDVHKFNYLITDKMSDPSLLKEFDEIGVTTVALDPLPHYED